MAAKTKGPALTAAACRAARALLDWSVADLVREASVSPNAVAKVEGGRKTLPEPGRLPVPRIEAGTVTPAVAAKIVAAFNRHGVQITGDAAKTGATIKRTRRSDA